MNQTIANLYAVLRAIDVAHQNTTPEQRTTVQKAIYLAQAKGVNLHYRFHYTSKGPYCRDLAADHCTLNEQPQETLEEIGTKELREPYASALANVRELVHTDREPALQSKEWITILAFVDYLRRVGKLDQQAASQKLAQEQPALAVHADAAANALASHNML